MTSIALEAALQRRLEQVAHDLGRSPEDIVGEAVVAHLDELETQKLDMETAAFEAMHPTLKETHLNQFVAIHRGELVDADLDLGVLYQRVQQRFGDAIVLIRQVEELPDREFVFHSTRLEPDR